MDGWYHSTKGVLWSEKTSMFNIEVDDQNTAERMAYIDFKLRFTGSINRSDLNHMFGLAEASASKVMAKYSSLRPENMRYNPRLRFNEIVRESFNPLLNLDSETALGMLANGFNKNKLYDKPVLNYVRVGNVSNGLKIENIEKITRAMSSGYAIRCKYLSSNSNNHDYRLLLPLSLLFDGRNWIFRAYHRIKNGKGVFRNFNFSRACEVEELIDDKRNLDEELASDKEWNTKIPLVLVPHGRLSQFQNETLKVDFGLVDDKLVITERIALLWFLYNIWDIDTRSESEYQRELIEYNERVCNKNSHDREGINNNYKHYNFRLANKDMVDIMVKSLSFS